MKRREQRKPDGCFLCGRTDLVPLVDTSGDPYMGCPSCRFVAPEQPKTVTTLKDARAEVERLRAQSDGRHTANLALCAELERMRTEALMAKGLIQGLVTERDAAEARLATATALLREARGVIYTDDGSNLGERIQAFLAAEPAAPARAEAEHDPGCRFEREYPAIDPEDCPRCSRRVLELEP